VKRAKALAGACYAWNSYLGCGTSSCGCLLLEGWKQFEAKLLLQFLAVLLQLSQEVAVANNGKLIRQA
jgi:hypothetical protein